MRIRSIALPLISALVAATGCENVSAPTEPHAFPQLRFAFGVFDWDVPPVAFTEFYVRPCEHCDSIQGIRSGYRNGSYGVDLDGDGLRDGTLTVDVELVSEVIPAGGGNYEYTWTLSNKGTGAIVGFNGRDGPDFSFTTDSPLLGRAGADRVVGTADDLPAGQLVTSSRIGGFPRTYAWGITVNPSTGQSASLYGPPEAQGPVTSNVATSPDQAPVGSPVTLSALVDDASTGSSTIVAAEFNVDGGSFSPISAHDGAYDEVTEAVSATLIGSLATGVHTLCVRGRDAAGNTGAQSCTLLVVYDASAGFVTGGGWIQSPAGAWPTDQALAGRADFGFVSAYQKGATTPSGQTVFHFALAGLRFKGIAYDWMLVAGARAQYKGTGTINGGGDYGFLLTAIDGSSAGGGGSDRLRIKIWDRNHSDAIVYDNEQGTADANSPTTGLGGGSITIHK